MNKIVILGLLVIVALVGGLVATGCAAPAPAPTPAPAPAPAPAPTPAPAPAPTAPEEVITWKAQSSFDAGSPEYPGGERVAEAVRTMSDGRFIIDMFPGGYLSSD